MKKISSYYLYQKRYVIGFTTLIIVVIGLLFITLFFVPGAIRPEEATSALTSGALSMRSIEPIAFINLPYHILQRLSFIAFGVSQFSIKLPSAILALLTALGIFVLIRVWFRRNVAIITTVIAVTLSHFLFLSQDGTPSIMFSFAVVWLLVACTLMTRRQAFSTFWKVVAGVLVATILYMPLGIYVVLALLITASFHPHIRHMVRKVPKLKLLIAILLGMLALVPLVQAIIIKTDVGLQLLGIPISQYNIKDNVILVSKDLFGFFTASDSFLLRPIYSLGAIILVALGGYKYLTVNYTARSYTLFLIGIFILPFIILNPSLISYLFPLFILAIAMSIATLLSNWYKLFPRNPYARIAGLIPITILVGGMALTGTSRFINNYTYNPDLLASYHNDIKLLKSTLSKSYNQKNKLNLVATADEVPFYNLIAHYDKRFIASLKPSDDKDTMYTHSSYNADGLTRVPDMIITNRRNQNADRFYIYKTTVK